MSSTGVLYAVDPFTPGRLGFCWSELVARKEASRSRRDIVFVKQLGRDAARVIDGNFDMIFIDADHSFDGIRQDWNDWSPRIVPGRRGRASRYTRSRTRPRSRCDLRLLQVLRGAH